MIHAAIVKPSAQHARKLAIIKLLHSAIWLFMATCILLIPLAALGNRFRLAAMLIAVIIVECAVLAANRGTCPLTTIAARYTENRADNFDIFLPRWLARYNKIVFGALFVCGSAYAAFRWFAAQ